MIKKVVLAFLLTGLVFSVHAESRRAKMEKKLKIILPKVRLQNVTAEQAFEFVRRLSRDMDPEGKGVNIIFVKSDLPQKRVKK